MIRLKVLHIAPSYFPASYWGGPVFSTYGLNNALAKNPLVDLRVLTTDSAGPALHERINQDRLDVRALFPNYSVIFSRRIVFRSTSLEMLTKMPGLIRWADIVHVSATYSFPILPAFFICRFANKPLVWSPCGAIMDTEILPFSRRKSLKSIWEKVINMLIRPEKTVLHATSEEEKTISLSKIPRVRSQVIPRGVEEPPSLPQRNGQVTSRFRLLFLSRLDPKKGLENLLEALAILDDPTISLHICGSGDPGYIRSLMDKVQLSGLLDSQVKFSGQVTGDQKEASFLGADVFILPSHSESFGVAIAEALAYGLPVIVSRNTPWQGVEENGCGLWVNNDPHSLASAIRRIRGMDLQAMSRNGREWMRRDFSWEKVARSMFNVYQSLQPEGHGTSSE